jgi:hypothetical protein
VIAIDRGITHYGTVEHSLRPPQHLQKTTRAGELISGQRLAMKCPSSATN